MATGNVRGHVLVAFVCEQMKWSYQEYQAAPLWLVDTIIEMRKIDGLKSKK